MEISDEEMEQTLPSDANAMIGKVIWKGTVTFIFSIFKHNMVSNYVHKIYSESILLFFIMY